MPGLSKLRARVPALALAAALALVALPAIAPPVHALEAAFARPTATAELGEPITFRTTLRSTEKPLRVELLTRLPDREAVFVEQAEVAGGAGRYTAEIVQEDGHVVPNTTFVYRFRAVYRDGAELGPEARVTVEDRRFPWRVKEGRLVRLHWYEGDERFAERALEIGEDAVDSVSELLGVTEEEPIDFFVYASEAAFRDALGPGTRENVGGQANAEIRTLFALIGPSEIDSAWVGVVIPHELTHLVFNTAVDNPYHFPPRWLNEGIAVHLSEGYGQADRRRVSDAVARDALIPLDGLVGQFPTTREGFALAYSESVSAVDYFIRRYGRDTLVKLVRSYAGGVSDDDAFRAATGAGVDAFSDAWIADVGGRAPAAVGPRPGAPGPVPPGWTVGGPEDSPGPSASGAANAGRAGSSAAASPAAGGSPVGDGSPGGDDRTVALVLVGALGALGIGLVLVAGRRGGRTSRDAGSDLPPAPPA